MNDSFILDAPSDFSSFFTEIYYFTREDRIFFFAYFDYVFHKFWIFLTLIKCEKLLCALVENQMPNMSCDIIRFQGVAG